MIALLVIFTVIGLSGLMMLLAGTQLQAARAETMQRDAQVTMMKAEAILAEHRSRGSA